jgi:hypothetical protein
MNSELRERIDRFANLVTKAAVLLKAADEESNSTCVDFGTCVAAGAARAALVAAFNHGRLILNEINPGTYLLCAYQDRVAFLALRMGVTALEMKLLRLDVNAGVYVNAEDLMACIRKHRNRTAN